MSSQSMVTVTYGFGEAQAAKHALVARVKKLEKAVGPVGSSIRHPVATDEIERRLSQARRALAKLTEEFDEVVADGGKVRLDREPNGRKLSILVRAMNSRAAVSVDLADRDDAVGLVRSVTMPADGQLLVDVGGHGFRLDEVVGVGFVRNPDQREQIQSAERSAIRSAS